MVPQSEEFVIGALGMMLVAFRRQLARGAIETYASMLGLQLERFRRRYEFAFLIGGLIMTASALLALLGILN
jgi:hypothetical protein